MGDLLNPKPFAWLGQTQTDREEERSIALFATAKEERGNRRPVTLDARTASSQSSSGAAASPASPSRYDDTDPTTLAEYQRLDRHMVRLDLVCAWLACLASVLLVIFAMSLLVHWVIALVSGLI